MQAECTHEWEIPVRQVGPGALDAEIDGDDYCTRCGVERHEVEPTQSNPLPL